MQFKFNPALISETVRQILLALVLFGVIHWTDAQMAGVLMAISALLAMFTISQTVATGVVEAAGTSKAQLHEAARQNDAAGTPGGTGNPNEPGGAGGSNAPRGLGNFSDKSTRGLMLALAFIPSLFIGGCAKSDPNTVPKSPERQVALYGIRANSTLKATRETVAALYGQQVVSKPAYDKFLTAYIEVSKAGEQLAAALAAYDAATTDVARNALVPQIDAAIVAFGTLLPGVVPEVTSPDGRAKVGQLVGEVQKLLVTIARLTAPRTSYLLPADLVPLAA